MTVRPIIFYAPMIRALLAGHKTMTRRVMKPQPENSSDGMIRFKDGGWFAPSVFSAAMECAGLKAPYEPGDLLYVRENWRTVATLRNVAPSSLDRSNSIYFDADADWSANYSLSATRPSIHMPRWASRITLEVTAVKIEPLLDISEADAIAEGFAEGRLDDGFAPRELSDGYTIESHGTFCSAIGMFQIAWAKLHPEWDGYSSPWVVAISFTVHRQNVDALIAERAEA